MILETNDIQLDITTPIQSPQINWYAQIYFGMASGGEWAAAKIFPHLSGNFNK